MYADFFGLRELPFGHAPILSVTLIALSIVLSNPLMVRGDLDFTKTPLL